MTENQNNQSKEAKKVLDGFDKVMSKLTAIVGGESNLKPVTKVQKSEAKNIVDELFREEREANEEQIKSELKELLKNHVLLNKTLKEERAKLDKLEIAKKKEFNTAANKLFNRISDIDSLVTEYAESFNAAKDGAQED